MKQYRSRAPKNRKNEGMEAAVKFILAPAAIALKLTKKRKRRKSRK